jgi:hypothetical protein
MNPYKLNTKKQEYKFTYQILYPIYLQLKKKTKK